MCNTLSSQCLTLESIVLLFWSRTQLYKCCNTIQCYIVSDVIPVLDTGIQFLLYSYLVCSFTIKFSGSQCQSTGMTPFLVEISLNSQRLYSCTPSTGMASNYITHTNC
ncbi:hypothetical protein [Wolbachia endosymbiont (group B) of Limnophora tigrina]|uniref:hypothetical protein n=1 Tax=Wolbachia endosymbiont (group B) of Limnophora tigrina TaxID=3139317 RepID=UPI00397B0199